MAHLKQKKVLNKSSIFLDILLHVNKDAANSYALHPAKRIKAPFLSVAIALNKKESVRKLLEAGADLALLMRKASPAYLKR